MKLNLTKKGQPCQTESKQQQPRQRQRMNRYQKNQQTRAERGLLQDQKLWMLSMDLYRTISLLPLGRKIDLRKLRPLWQQIKETLPQPQVVQTVHQPKVPASKPKR